MLFEKNEEYKRKVHSYWERGKKIDKEIEALKKKKENMRYPEFKRVFKPLFEKVKEDLGADGYVTYGPFGLCCERSTYWSAISDTGVKGKILGSLTLTDMHPNGFLIRNRKENTGQYNKGTIGELNGMNHPTIDITEDITYEWLLDFIKSE